MFGKSIIAIFLGLMSALMLSAQEEHLIGYWSFEETGDTIYDHTGNENHGINYGAVSVSGVKGNALYFQGRDTESVDDDKSSQANGDFVEIKGPKTPAPAVLRDQGTGSISFWFKVYEIPSEHGIAPMFYYGTRDKCDHMDAANEGLIVELGHSPIYPKNESLFFTIFKNGCTFPSCCWDTNSPTSKNEWHHFVGIVGEDYNTGYLDGEELIGRKYNFGGSDDSQFFADALSHDKLWIGKGHWDRTEQYFNGVIDELKIFSEPLTRREVKSLYDELNTATSNQSPGEPGNRLTVYPNPVTSQLHYDQGERENKLNSIRIMNVSGKLVMSKSDLSLQGRINISSLPAGVYFIEFAGKETVVKKKVVVQ